MPEMLLYILDEMLGWEINQLQSDKINEAIDEANKLIAERNKYKSVSCQSVEDLLQCNISKSEQIQRLEWELKCTKAELKDYKQRVESSRR